MHIKTLYMKVLYYINIVYFYLYYYNNYFIMFKKFNGLILLYCLTYKSISRVSGAYDHKMH